MVIMHNLMANYTNRQLNINSTGKSKAAERLGSGYKVNRAADNAAGLSCSEKMRGQIRGLEKAADNCQNAISLINVADGAMGEMQSVLQRIRELTVQAANDTYVTVDRQAIAEEITQLTKEVDNIGNNTEFNTLKLLQGSGKSKTRYETRTVTEVTYQDHGAVPTYTNLNCNTEYYFSAQDITLDDGTVISGSAQNSTDGKAHYSYELSFAQIQSQADWESLHDAGFTFKCTLGCKQEFTFQFDKDSQGIVDETPNAVIASGGESNNKVFKVGTSGYTTGADFVNDLVNFIQGLSTDNANTHVGHDNQIGTTGNGAAIVIYGSSKGSGDDGYLIVGLPVVQEVEKQVTIIESYESPLVIQTGANSNQIVLVGLPHLDATTLSMRTISVADSQAATGSIAKVDQMLETVSRERSRMGAYANRFEHSYANAENMAENLQSAESRIRDADMAEEMVVYSKFNILEQAAQAMLAQANQSQQGVIQLLQ